MKTTDRRHHGRRKVHSNRFKRMRKGIESALIESGVPFASVGDRLLIQHMVPSKRMQVSIKRELSHDFPSLEDWGNPSQVFENMALLWVVHPDSPRGIYQRVKKRVQANRTQERKRIFRELRDRIRRGIADAVEHARAEGIQQEYASVPGLQGLGLPDPAQGEGSDQGERRLPDVSGAGKAAEYPPHRHYLQDRMNQCQVCGKDVYEW